MFDPNLHYGEDLDWFMRAREKNIIIANIPQFSLTYRLHPGGMTYGKKIPELNVVSVLKKSLDRRRQQQKTPQLFQPIITQQQSLISVIIPAYNAAKYLVESINSVVTQSYSPFEIIVVDDGSKDATAQIAAQFGTQIRYFRQDNAGAGAARNRGVEMAHGHWLGFLDADDVWEPDKLAVQMDVFQKNPNIHMVFGHIQEFYSNDLVETTTTPANKIPGYDCGCLLIRRQHFLEVGLFSRGWEIGEFVDWFSKALDKNFQYLPLPQILYRRRIHSDNLGRRATQWQKDYTSILKLHLDRRRKKANESKEIPPPLLTT